MSDTFAILQSEANGEPYRVNIESVGKFEIPHINSVNVFDLNEAIDRAVTDLDVIINALRVAMPADDFKRLREANLNKPTLVSLYNAWNAHCGLDTGESKASPS